jgi:tripartite-type tricarboxylate transporter receptor subunit TctC
MNSFSRRSRWTCPVLLGALANLVPAAAIQAQDLHSYPSETVQIIVPYVPGGTSDTLSRAIAQKLTEKWGHPVIIVNKPGANGIIGIEAAAHAKPDGLTLLVAEGPAFTVNPSVYKKLPYDPLRDFAPITRLTSYGTMLVVHASLPVHTVAEFVALAKARPGELAYGSFGIGSGGHMTMEAFKLREGIELTHVPYKGSAQVQTDLIAGRLAAVFISVQSTLQQIQSGTLRALAFANPTRSRLLPDVPTFSEAGIANFEATTWFCMMAPAGTPSPVIGKIHDDVVSVIRDPAFVEQWFTNRDAEPIGDTPGQLAQLIAKEIPMWAEVVRSANIPLQ